MTTDLALIIDNIIPILIVSSIIGLIAQYYWLNHLNKTVKQLAIILLVLFVLLSIGGLYMNFSKNEITLIYQLLLVVAGLFVAGNMLVFPVSLGLRKVVHYYRRSHFIRVLKKSVVTIDSKQLMKLSKALKRFAISYDLEDKEKQQLQSIYKQVRNHKAIAHQAQMTFAQVLIICGVSNIDLPRTYDLNVDVLSSTEHVLQVAYSALKEAREILELAPNASLCACRKYVENLTKYLIAHHQLQVDVQVTEDNFSTLLHVLNQSAVIKEREIIQKMYQLKEVGNDAAHNQICDIKTARDMFDEAIVIENWFRKRY